MSAPVPSSDAPQRDTTLVRALAALLVTNSHLEHFYPVPWLAGDGLVGNSLFFLLAGYGLVRSEQVRVRPFPGWLRRRIDRIYPTLVPVVLVFYVLIGAGWRTWDLGDYVTSFAWPTGYTFVQLVIPFYLLFFPILRARRPSAYVAGMCAAAVVYLAAFAYDVQRLTAGAPVHLGERFIGVHAAAYFQVMLLGGWLASPAGVTPRAAASPLTLAALGAVYVGAKLAMVHGVLGRAYPLLHVLTFAICACMFAAFTSARCVGWARSVRPVWAVASFVGALTLELYLVHSPIATYEWLWRVPFPANIAVFWLLTLPLAVLAGRVGARLQRLVGATESSAAPTRPPDRPADDLGARVSRAGR